MAPSGIPMTDDDIARRLSTFLASTPPDSDHQDHLAADSASQTAEYSDIDSLWAQHGGDAKFSLSNDHHNHGTHAANPFSDGAIMVPGAGDFEPDFESMINLDALGGFDESGFGVMQGESGGFALDMDWMQGVGGSDGLGGCANDGTVAMEEVMV